MLESARMVYTLKKIFHFGINVMITWVNCNVYGQAQEPYYVIIWALCLCFFRLLPQIWLLLHLLERSLSSFNTFPYLVICDLRACAETAVNCRVY